MSGCNTTVGHRYYPAMPRFQRTRVGSGSRVRVRPARFLALALALIAAAACARSGSATLSAAERSTIAKEIDAQVRAAYDLSKPDVDARMLALYADTGRVVSATGGRVLTSRDSLAQGIHYFWRNVGVNMRQPQWTWTHTYVDVLSPNAAVFTGTYHVPHLTPRGEPHDIGGAMTLVFERRGGKWGVVQEHLSDLPQPAPRDSGGRP